MWTVINEMENRKIRENQRNQKSVLRKDWQNWQVAMRGRCKLMGFLIERLKLLKSWMKEGTLLPTSVGRVGNFLRLTLYLMVKDWILSLQNQEQDKDVYSVTSFKHHPQSSNQGN